eukprot:scaffold425_cov175-Amphora_coffeaeformis.AAC.35
MMCEKALGGDFPWCADAFCLSVVRRRRSHKTSKAMSTAVLFGMVVAQPSARALEKWTGPPRSAVAASRSPPKQALATMAQENAVNPTVRGIGCPLCMAVPTPPNAPRAPAKTTRAPARSKSSMMGGWIPRRSFVGRLCPTRTVSSLRSRQRSL